MNDPNVTSSTDLYHEIYGRGDPLLCIHGFGASLFTWRNFIEPFGKDRRLILIDLKGAGKSPKPLDKFYSTLDHANLLYDFLLKQDLRNLTLVGNSFGGALVLLLSIMLMGKGEIGRLRSLVLLDAGAYKEYIPPHVKIFRIPLIGKAAIYLTPPKLAAKLILRKAYFDRRKITRDQIETYAAAIAAPGGRHALLETGRQIVPPNFPELVEKYRDIHVPTLIVWGRDDRVIPLVVGEMLNQAIPNSTLKLIDECGHVPQEEKPSETIALVTEFLDRA
jgi:pimeloyl-ACP methyl ester carboxylesterase